jgi:hypothetical protein
MVRLRAAWQIAAKLDFGVKARAWRLNRRASAIWRDVEEFCLCADNGLPGVRRLDRAEGRSDLCTQARPRPREHGLVSRRLNRLPLRRVLEPIRLV